MEKFSNATFNKSIFTFFEKIQNLGEMSIRKLQVIYFLNCLQFLSLNLDQHFWGSNDFFQSDLLKMLFAILKPFQFHLMEYFRYFDNIIFSFWLFIILFITSNYFMISISQTFHFLRKSVKIYNDFFILFISPIFQSFLSPFHQNNMDNMVLIVLSTLGIFLLIIHSLFNLYFINENMFNEKNRLNRLIYKLDILNHFVIILPIIFGIFLGNFQYAFYFSASTQIFCFLLLILNYNSTLVYFDVKVSMFQTKILFFKVFVLLVEILGVIIQKNCGVAILLMFSFAAVFSNNLVEKRMSNFLFATNEDSKRHFKNEEERFLLNFKRWFMIFSYFYYQGKLEGKNFENLANTFPLQLLICVSKKNEINKCEKLKQFQEKIRNYVIQLCEKIKFIRENQIFLFSIIMPFFLLKQPRIFPAIRLIEKIQKKSHFFSFFDSMNFLYFLECIKTAFGSFEKNSNVITLNENALISKTTNFFPQKFYQFNRNYEKLSKEIEKYTKNTIIFLENIKSENPNIQMMEKKGIELLKTQKKITNNFKIGEENPIFIYKYSMFLQTFRPDMKKEILKLIKKFNSLAFLEKTTLKENSHIYDFIIENLTFSTTSSFLYVSGGLENLGKIQKIDSTFLNLLEYKEKAELIGNNISMIIPTLVAENHQSYLENYLKTGKSSFSFTEQSVQLKKKNGELINVNLTIKPHLMEDDNKLILFCHLKSNIDRRIQSVVILDRFGFIDSYGGKISELFRPLFKLYGQKFYLQMFLPMLHDFFFDNIEKPDLKDFQEDSEDNIHFFLILEKYEHLQETIIGLDQMKIRKTLTKIKENFEDSQCGASKYRIDFELKCQKYNNLNFYILYIHSMAFVNFRNKRQLLQAQKTRKEGEFFLTAMPKYAVKTQRAFARKKKTTIHLKNLPPPPVTLQARRHKSVDYLEKSKTFTLKKRSKSEMIRGNDQGPKIKESTYVKRVKMLRNENKEDQEEEKKEKKEDQEKNSSNGQKFFGENKRFIFAESSEHDDEKKAELQSHPSVSSVQSTLGREFKENFFSLIEIHSVPSCYNRYIYFHFFLFLLAMMSLVFLSVILSSTITTINSGFNQTFLIENFKIRFLKTLFYAHKYKKFNSTFELSKINDQGNKMAVDFDGLLYPPFQNINDQVIDIYLFNKTERFTSIEAINFFNAIAIDSVVNPYKVDLIILNALNIFQLLENIADILEILLGIITSVKQNLIIYSSFVASISTIVVLFQIINLTLCYFFINDNYKKMLTIPNEELNKFLESIDENKSEKAETIQIKIKPKKTIQTFRIAKSKVNVKSTHKKKHPIELINFPILRAFLIAFISLSIFCCFVIIILYKASFLDYSIVTFLKGEVGFQRSKAYNYMYTIRRVNKLYLNNSYNYDDKDTMEVFQQVRDGVNVILAHANDFDGADKTNYLNEINANLCTAALATFPLAANLSSCPKLASGEYTKGMVGALSYAILLFENEIAGTFNFNIEPNIDLLDYSIILYDRQLRIVAQNTLNLVSANLNQESADSLNLNIVFLIITAIFLIGFYFFYLKKSLKSRLLNSKLVYQIIPSKILFKSSAIKSYLRRILNEKIRKN